MGPPSKLVLGWVAVALLLSSPLSIRASIPDGPGAGIERIAGEYKASIYCSGLVSPNGLARHPTTHEIYVCEEEAGRVSLVRDGKPVPVVDAGWSVEDNLPKWAITQEKPKSYWLRPKLRSPEGLAFSTDGHLYVTEDVPDGRLLEFIPSDTGAFATARAIPIPWFYKEFAWQSIAIGSDGRLFLAGSAAEAGPSLFFGVVLMRDLKGDWWVIDYGPFAGFSSVDLSRHEDVLIVGEEVNGSLTWWDTLRHRAVGTLTKTIPNLKHACALPDGAIVISQETVPEALSPQAGLSGRAGRLIRVDPTNGNTKELATGFGTIQSLLVDSQSGHIFVTEDTTGLVIELTPTHPAVPGPYLLETVVATSEMAAGLPPKKWPPFLKGFFRDLGVNPRDEVTRQGEQGYSADAPNTYTLVEVGEAVPLIAGTVTTLPGKHIGENDPYTGIDFLVLFPNRTFKSRGDSAAGLAFFSATRASGKVERTYSIDQLKALRFNSLTGWEKYADNASIFLPTASCAVRPCETGLDISLAFISLHDGSDYYLRIQCGQKNTGQLMVDSRSGVQSSYGVDFTGETLDGASYNSIVVAGFSSDEGQGTGWLNIGNWPMDYSISPSDEVPWTPYSAHQGPEVLETLWGTGQQAGNQTP